MNFQKCYEDLSSNYECLEASMMCFVQKQQLKSSLIGELLNPTQRQNLSPIEINILRNKFNIIIDHEVVCSSRISINCSVYHSLNYKYKRNSNSYTVCFTMNNKDYYGEILEFFSLQLPNQHDLFAKVRVFKLISDSNVYPFSSGYFYDKLINNGLLSRFFKVISTNITENNLDLIKCSSIKHKCLVIKTGAHNFISPLVYEFEHD